MQTRVNVAGTRNMINASLEKKAGRFIHTSSIAAFVFQESPITENSVSTAGASPINYFKG